MTNTVSARARILVQGSHTVSARARVRLIDLQLTVSAQARILSQLSNVISARALIQTYRVLEIISGVRDQELVKELTYVKDRVEQVSNGHAHVLPIVDNFANVGAIGYNRIRVNEIRVAKTVQTSWISAKAYILTG